MKVKLDMVDMTGGGMSKVLSKKFKFDPTHSCGCWWFWKKEEEEGEEGEHWFI
jgi:hypothetical protein